MQVRPYTSKDLSHWDALVAESRNGTFLFQRAFMDYHQDRFEDASLLFFSEKGKCLGAFPASRHAEQIKSHGGLTYGGLLLPHAVRQEEVLEMYTLLKSYYAKRGISTLRVKPVPPIYHASPCEEEWYALFRNGAKLAVRSASTTLLLSHGIRLSTLRQRKYKKALAAGLVVQRIDDISGFWQLLRTTLTTVHGVEPVHSCEELTSLKKAFPHEIQTFGVYNDRGELLGGTVLFLTDTVAHAQYIAASLEGRKSNALDLLFVELLQTKPWQTHIKYFDFGISTEEGGKILNEGLIFQKEGFGGRTIVYDEYEISCL